ncbi:J domain-containing protein [Gramella sp. MAR_2010_147]|uniref:DnaJ C-terminal domain-containing protein n=1 Tax=Gramella sp. MAR_2010_147 TaxID=1250205 RepID=UPI00087ADA9E|nr:J domain-containing protein [Gramella sp. MAR_2010_147]SDS44359.1 curved DNA-binding protein [Gramella sp. MAR_2010_147]
MDFIDYYKLLEINKSASQADIKKAYRKLARKYHPDLNPNDKEAQARFQQINEAHEVLSDPEKRKKYDEYGKDWQHADQFEAARKQQAASGGFSGGFGEGSQSRSYSGNFDDDTFSDFFEQMFGGRARAEGAHRGAHFKGQDFNAELQLRLSQIYKSEKHTLTVNGKNIRLSIPAGVENGQTIKIKGHGGPGVQGGPRGDLFLSFNILNDTSFRREKEHLYSTEEIDLSTAVLGGEIAINTFNGKVKLKVKPGTQNDSRIKLKGKGFPKYKKEGQFGDLYITYKVKVPERLTDRQKELFQELKKTGI